MVISKRERTVIAVTGAVIGLYLADRFFLTPVLDRRARIESESAQCQVDLQKAKSLFDQRRRLEPRWREMTDSGLGTGAAAAESRLLHSIRDWAQEAELTLASVKLERTENEKQFQKITWRATGTGSMAAVSRFLWRIQEASMPVRISDLQVTPRQEGTDSLQIQAGVATLCLAAGPDAEKAAPSNAKGAGREGKE